MLDLIVQRLKSKTYLTSLALAIITAIEMNFQFLSTFIPAEYRQYAMFVWPVAMLTLREVTTSALSEK